MSDVLVVTVPDFVTDPALFEARTLLFLGSWSDNAGAARAWRLHLACIGEPPASVRRVAQRCGAGISVHRTFPAARYWNKLRGFDAPRANEWLVIADTDIVTLGDPSALLDARPGIAAPLAINNRVPMSAWERVYARCGELLPSERVLCARARMVPGLPSTLARRRNLEPMPPYYNGGMISIPAALVDRLASLWRRNLDTVMSLALESDDPADRKFAQSDQTALAISLQTLAREGTSIREIDPALHGSWEWLLSGRLRERDTCLYHAFGLFRQGDDADRRDPLRQVDLHVQQALRHGGHDTGRAEIEALGRRLRELVARHVVPHAGEHGRHDGPPADHQAFMSPPK